MVVMSGESLTYGEQEGFDPGAQWIGSLSIPGGPNRLIEPMVKMSSQATSPATLYEQVVRAGELAQRPPIGPVYLNVPIETMLAPWTPPDRFRKVPRAPKPRPSESDVERIADMLVKAKSPVIITEGAGREVEGYNALIALAETLSIPVVEGAVSEVSNFPKDSPLHQGFEVGPFLKAADLVLLVRCRVPWYPAKNRPSGTVVMIDENPFKTHMVYQNFQADDYLEGYVPATLQMLAEAVRASKPDAVKVKDARTKWEANHDKVYGAYAEAEQKARKNGAIHAMTLCSTYAKVLPKDSIYVDECTTHGPLNKRYIASTATQSYFKVPSGLGQGLGTALGVKLGAGDRTVVSCIGDGAFLYNPVVQSLGVSRDENIPIIIVVYNNRGYRAMKQNQLSYYPDGAGKQNNLFYGETINGPNYEELAAPFGGVGIKVESAEQLPDALKKAHAATKDGKTAIVNVPLV
jgi:acetolactate synthase-1/2/3 large subunit